MFNLFPQKEKTTFVASFGDNILHTVKEVERQTEDQVVILQTSQCKINFNNASDRVVLRFETLNLIDWLKSIYHLATSRHIFVDNYYGFLAVTHFKSNVNCVQLWHAAGAIKQFGLKDPSNDVRNNRAMDRFEKVYNRFDHVVVGSEKMTSIFKDSFGIPNERILRSGIPRTDFFFDTITKKRAEQSLSDTYPLIQGKKIILYAPTYRDDQLHVSNTALDIKHMHEQLKDDYVLLLRLHPAMKVSLNNDYPDFVIDVSSDHYLNHLLVITDVLITDYSSIPFEFSLLNRPMVFFAYDLEGYTKSRGFWEDYEGLVPGPIVRDTASLVRCIEADDFDLAKVRSFAQQWNQYSRGNSSEQLIQAIYHEHKQYQVVDQL